jgi:hypothetical protein
MDTFRRALLEGRQAGRGAQAPAAKFVELASTEAYVPEQNHTSVWIDLVPDLKTISAFARMEYKLGDPERGKTIFEGIVESHPKRNDLWSVYIDMEASQNNIQSVR